MGRPADDRAPDEPEFRLLVASKLTAVRRHRGVTQATISEQLAVTPNTASNWMTGATTPSVYDLVRLAALLDVPPTVLVDPDAMPNDAVRAAMERDERAMRQDMADLRGSDATSLADPAASGSRSAARTGRP